ncbi:MAG: hypothetical protein H7Z17_15090 [Fuerstia sp.]|nr:hypothetical protein [Fuerstiella sp.]
MSQTQPSDDVEQHWLFQTEIILQHLEAASFPSVHAEMQISDNDFWQTWLQAVEHQVKGIFGVQYVLLSPWLNVNGHLVIGVISDWDSAHDHWETSWNSETAYSISRARPIALGLSGVVNITW